MEGKKMARDKEGMNDFPLNIKGLLLVALV
jgi:hypothetical protein